MQDSDVVDLLKLLKPEKTTVFMGAAAAFLSSSFLFYYPTLTTDVELLRSLKYDALNSASSYQIQAYYYYKWGGVALFTGVAGGMRRYLNQQICNKVAIRMRHAMFQKMLRNRDQISLHSQQLVHKLSNDVSLVAGGLSIDIFAFIRGLLFSVGGTAYLLYYALPLLPLSVACMGTFSLSAIFFAKYMANAKIAETSALEYLSKVAQERLTAYKLIRISNMEEKEISRYVAQLCRWYRDAQTFASRQALNMAVLEGGGLLVLMLILFKGCFLISTGQLDPDLVRYGAYALMMASGMRTMINIQNEMVKTAAIYKTILNFYPNLHEDELYKSADFVRNHRTFIQQDDEYLEMLKNPSQHELQLYEALSHTPPCVEFRGVSFGYEGHPLILSNYNMKVEGGQIVALVGSSGSGKSTILNLLTKLASPTAGEILIDGERLAEKDFTWIQRYVSYVQQDGVIFNASVYENIIYGNQGFDCSLKSVIEAARMARAHEFISKMPDGYLTQLKSDGSTSLSGGQKQRIVLARAILKNPKILILDEATSNIDGQAETEIIAALMEICKGKTVFVVTHKLENFKQMITQNINL